MGSTTEREWDPVKNKRALLYVDPTVQETARRLPACSFRIAGRWTLFRITANSSRPRQRAAFPAVARIGPC